MKADAKITATEEQRVVPRLHPPVPGEGGQREGQSTHTPTSITPTTTDALEKNAARRDMTVLGAHMVKTVTRVILRVLIRSSYMAR